MHTLKPIPAVCLFFALFLSISASSQTSSEPPARQQTPHDFLQAMVGQKLIMLQFGDADKTKIKKNDLNKIKMSCDLAVQIQTAHQDKDRVSIDWEQIGTPTLWAGKHPPRTCRDRMFHEKGTLLITGFAPEETADSLAAALSKVLQTPEQYLATAGIIFNLPPEPDIQGAVPGLSWNDGARPLLVVDPSFSEQARKSKYNGTVQVMFYVGTDGRAHRPSIPQKLGMGLDQQALNVVPLWRFKPAHKLDQPVPSSLSMEISFNLY